MEALARHPLRTRALLPPAAIIGPTDDFPFSALVGETVADLKIHR
jgi:hypothetical protein